MSEHGSALNGLCQVASRRALIGIPCRPSQGRAAKHGACDEPLDLVDNLLLLSNYQTSFARRLFVILSISRSSDIS